MTRQPADDGTLRQLSHDQTLTWIERHHAWRLARKTKPMWARRIEPAEVGQELQTADHVAQVAKEGFWLCVGVAGEPWFQAAERVGEKYERRAEEVRQFAFDKQPRTYGVFHPREALLNWAAQVNDPAVAGFFIRPRYDPGRPLYSAVGGYVVKDHVSDPYTDKVEEVWLVQQELFDSTYEFVP